MTAQFWLLDEDGQPLSARLHTALVTLAPRLQRQFPALSDVCLVTEVLEEAGQRIAAREQRQGPLDRLEAYAWVVIRRLATLRVRHDLWIADRLAHLDEAHTAMHHGRKGAFGTPEEMEARILYGQLFAHLTPDEQQLLRARQAELTVDEIATLFGVSPRHVMSTWRRITRKLRGFATRTRAKRTASVST